VVAILGSWQSAVTLATTQIAERYKTPHIIPAGGIVTRILKRGFKYTFRITPDETVLGKTMLECQKWINNNFKPKAKTMAILYEHSDFGSTQAKYWRDHANEYGLRVVVDEGHPHTATDLSSHLAKVKASKADIIMAANYTSDAILINKTRHELKLNIMGYMACGGGEAGPKYLEAVGAKQAEGVLVLELFSPKLKHPRVQEVGAKFKRKFGYDMTQFSAGTYSGTWLLAHALETTGQANREAIREALTKVDYDWNNSKSVLPWKLTFDEKGQAPAFCMINQYRKGDRHHIIYPKKFATIDVTWPLSTYKP
jgi:branched-chain amino acid transport system substrate-binding protein